MKECRFPVLVLMALIFLAPSGIPLSGQTAGGTVKLPEPSKTSGVSVEQALLTRRSIRTYKDEALELSEVGQVLWAAQGTTDPRGLRTTPSAGALYPLEAYLVAGKVNGLAPGIYKYRTAGHELVKVADGDLRARLGTEAVRQASVSQGAAVLVFAAVYERLAQKYKDRAVRYANIEVGCAAQNVYLQAVSLGLGTVFIGSFQDQQVKSLLKMDQNEEPLCIMPLGRK